jgi:hypothetical protein
MVTVFYFLPYFFFAVDLLSAHRKVGHETWDLLEIRMYHIVAAWD